MAMDMNDQNLLTNVIGQDFVLAEVKYHFKCLTYYRNEYCNHKNAQLSEESTGPGMRYGNTAINYQQCKSKAFIDLYQYVMSELRKGETTFGRADLKAKCQDNLK